MFSCGSARCLVLRYDVISGGFFFVCNVECFIFGTFPASALMSKGM